MSTQDMTIVDTVDLEQLQTVIEAMAHGGAETEDFARMNTAWLQMTGDDGLVVANARRESLTAQVEDILAQPATEGDAIRATATAEYKSRAFDTQTIDMQEQADELRQETQRMREMRNTYIIESGQSYIFDEDIQTQRLQGLQEIAEIANDFYAPNAEMLQDYADAYAEALNNNDFDALEYKDVEINTMPDQLNTTGKDISAIPGVATPLTSTQNMFEGPNI